MKSSIVISSKMRVVKAGAAALAGAFLLTACGFGAGDKEETTITLTKDGTVASRIVESFEQSYYDKEELQQKILSEAATYNRSAGSGNISVDKVAVEGGQAEVKITYAQPEDYAAFNRVTFFVGTPKEAEEAGYDLNVVLSGVKNPGETVGKSDILQEEDMLLLITNTRDTVVLNGKAVYASDNAVVSDNQKTVSTSPQDEGNIFILYK